MTVTPKHLDLLRHALGMESRQPGFRNYFAAEPWSEDDAVWSEMVVEGLAVKTREGGGVFAHRYYAATDKGKRAVGLLPEKP